MTIETTFPPNAKALFWDVNLDELDPARHKTFIIERILNMGDHLDLRWLWHTFSVPEIQEVVRSSRKLSKKTARCWQHYFELKEEQMRCFSTFSMSPDNYY